MSQRGLLTLFGFCIFVLSQAAVLVRLSDTTPDQIGFWRMAISLPILGSLLVYTKEYKQLFRHEPRVWARLFLCSLFLFAHWRLWFMAVERTTVANANVCFALSPLLTALGAWVFFNEKISSRLGLAIGLGLTGILIMVMGGLAQRAGVANTHEGDIFGLISTACFAGYILAGKSLRRKMSNLNFTFLAYFLVGIYFAACLAATGADFVTHTRKTWIALLALSFGPTLFGHAVFTYCLNYLNVNFMTCSTLLEPIFAALMAAVLFGENLSVATLIAFGLISAGVLILYQPNLKKQLT